MTKTILHFIKKYWPATGGIQTHVHELSKAQATSISNTSIHIATVNNGEQINHNAGYPVKGHNIPLVDLPIAKDHIFNHAINSMPTSLRLKRIVKNIDADVVHIHDLPFELLPFVKFIPSGQVTLVITVHSSYFLNKRGTWLDTLFKQMLEAADHIIAPSEELRSEVAALIDESKVNSISFVSNGVPNQFFTDITPKNSNRYQILCPRRLYEKNGVRYLAEATAYIDDLLESFEVIFAGEGPERARIEKIVEESGQRGNVKLLGEVDYDQMPRLYSNADISVFPSLKEATSIAALESMASGTPVVATNVGGLPQIIDNGQEGKLIHPKDPKQLAEAIVDILTTASYQDYQKRARQRAQKHSWEKIATDQLPY